ncbi:uncharacterized protein LOC121046842, partial [Ixodes scapularis]|uniref:uncharacterized protein LOC121046842 n=1 Tax=Ixodes scapularis TaxID=6945 RepID=UPI001C38D4D3
MMLVCIQTGSPASISSVAVRLPPYYDRNPRVWFLQAESQFHLSGVTSQESKYHHVVSALSLAAADEVYDILAQPSATASYDQLKAALLQRTEASDRSRLQELLSAEELGDRRPSQLLRRMTQLLGDRANTIGDALLRELFIQRLPTNVQMVLATATALDLTGLAALADAVIEVATPSVASVTSAAEDGSEAMPAPPGTPSLHGNLERLCQRLEESVTAATHQRDRPRTQQQRGRSTSRCRNADRSRSASSADVCVYHRRYGSDARHCLRPCSWSKPIEATSSQNLPGSRLFYIADRTTGTRYLVDTGAEVSAVPAKRADRSQTPIY